MQATAPPAGRFAHAAAAVSPLDARAPAPGGQGALEPAELRAFARLQPLRWLRDLALDWGLILAAFWAFQALGRPWLALPLFALFIGSRQHALALLGHDATHRLALPSRFWNDRLGEVLAGWPLGAIMDGGYRPWHLAHHRRLGTAADPELAYRGRPPYTGRVSFARIAGRFAADMLGLGVPGLWAFLREILPERPWRYAGPLALYAGLAAVCAWWDAMWIFVLWTASVATGFWAVFRIRTWLEHVGLERAGRQGSHRFSAGPVPRFLFFPHNTHCHYEHHLYPQVPYPSLPRLRELLVEREGPDGRPVVPLRRVLERFHRLDGATPTPAA